MKLSQIHNIKLSASGAAAETRAALRRYLFEVGRSRRPQRGNKDMRMLRTMAFALGLFGAAAVGAAAPVMAQGFYLNAPGVHVHVGRHYRHYPAGPYYDYNPGYGYYGSMKPCPEGFTVQDGVCKPYRGY
jgi:hypothetical protein